MKITSETDTQLAAKGGAPLAGLIFVDFVALFIIVFGVGLLLIKFWAGGGFLLLVGFLFLAGAMETRLTADKQTQTVTTETRNMLGLRRRKHTAAFSEVAGVKYQKRYVPVGWVSQTVADILVDLKDNRVLRFYAGKEHPYQSASDDDSPSSKEQDFANKLGQFIGLGKKGSDGDAGLKLLAADLHTYERSAPSAVTEPSASAVSPLPPPSSPLPAAAADSQKPSRRGKNIIVILLLAALGLPVVIGIANDFANTRHYPGVIQSGKLNTQHYPATILYSVRYGSGVVQQITYVCRHTLTIAGNIQTIQEDCTTNDIQKPGTATTVSITPEGKTTVSAPGDRLAADLQYGVGAVVVIFVIGAWLTIKYHERRFRATEQQLFDHLKATG
jgi:hypothetical protein